MRDEVRQRGLRLRGRDGETAGGVGADECHVAVGGPGVEVGPDLGVDLVLLGPPRPGDVELRGALGRGLPVVVVEVPGTAGR